MTLANENLYNKPSFCIVCAGLIPADRLQKNRKTITCSDEHYDIRARMLRKKSDDQICRFCHKPSTPAQRETYARFSRWERQNPQLAHPEAWKVADAAGMSAPDFGRAVAQAKRRDVILDVKYAHVGWGSTKLHRPSEPTPELDRLLAMLQASAPPATNQVEKEEADEAA